MKKLTLQEFTELLDNPSAESTPLEEYVAALDTLSRLQRAQAELKGPEEVNIILDVFDLQGVTYPKDLASDFAYLSGAKGGRREGSLYYVRLYTSILNVLEYLIGGGADRESLSALIENVRHDAGSVASMYLDFRQDASSMYRANVLGWN